MEHPGYAWLALFSSSPISFLLSSVSSFLWSSNSCVHTHTPSRSICSNLCIGVLVYVFMMCPFRTSLYLNWGLPLLLVPSANSPKRICLGFLLSSILVTCPSHLRRCCLMIDVRLCTLACSSKMMSTQTKDKLIEINKYACFLIKRIDLTKDKVIQHSYAVWT